VIQQTSIPATTPIPSGHDGTKILKCQTSDYTYITTVYSNTVTIYITSPYLYTSIYSSTDTVDFTTTETETSTEVLDAQETTHTTTTRIITGTRTSTDGGREMKTDTGITVNTDANVANTNGGGGGGMKTGTKAGIGGGVAGGALLLAAHLALCIRKRRKDRGVSEAPGRDTPVALGGPSAAATASSHNTPELVTKTPVMSQSPAPPY
jgi:LPXTG-motif cell wall-anchored protein